MFIENQKKQQNCQIPVQTLGIIKDLIKTKKNTFFLPSGGIFPEAGQVGYILNSCYNYGRDDREQKHYHSLFVNSRFEALQGAIKITRAKSLKETYRNSRDIFAYHPAGEAVHLFDPLKKGEEKALVPGVKCFSTIEEISEALACKTYAPTAIIIEVHENMPIEKINQLCASGLEKHSKIIYFQSQATWELFLKTVSQLKTLPDVLVGSEALTNHEVPFGSFSMSREIFSPWNHPLTCTMHVSTCGGNRLALIRAREFLLAQSPDAKHRQIFEAKCREIQSNDKERVRAYSQYVNPGLIEVYDLAGLNFDCQEAHGNKITYRHKSKNIELLDCTAAGGVAIRGHTPEDIIEDICEKHSPGENYWEMLCQELKPITPGHTYFPAVSGSTAVEIGIIMAMLAQKDKTRIIVFKNNYAGTTLLSYIGTESESMRKPFFPLYYDVLHLDPFNPLAVEILQKEIDSKKIALIWFELFQGQTAQQLPLELIELINEQKEKQGYLVGVDEVMTGLCRMGKFLYHDVIVQQPDIITLCKGLTDSVFPFGLTLVANKICEKARVNNPAVVEFFKSIYQNQLGAHIALHVIKVAMAGELAGHVQKIMPQLRDDFRKMSQSSPFIKAIQGDGLFYRFYFNYSYSWLKIFGKMGVQIGQMLLPFYICRLLIRKANLMLYIDRFIPALTMSETDRQNIIKKLNKILVKKPMAWWYYLSFALFIYRIIRSTKPTMLSRLKKVGFGLKRISNGIKFFSEAVRGKNVEKYYTDLGDSVYETLDSHFQDPNKPLWHNNGYWKEAKTYDEAGQALANLVGQAAHFALGDRVLDVGNGFGEQDIFWMESTDIAEIIGINITPIQVEWAKKRVQQCKLENKIKLFLGDAVQLDYESASFDKVIALECAFHFKTRDKFLQEAFRVLRPGGRFAATDMIPAPGTKIKGFYRTLGRKHGCLPIENMYDRHIYAQKLKDIGFKNVSVKSIAPYVFPGSAKYAMLRVYHKLSPESAIVQLTEEEILSDQWVTPWQKNFGISDYVLVSAEKP